MILICYGTRPEWIKVKPIIDELNKRKIIHKTLFTGQHKHIVSNAADFNLEINDNISDNRLNNIVSNIISIPSEIFENIKYVYKAIQHQFYLYNKRFS